MNQRELFTVSLRLLSLLIMWEGVESLFNWFFSYRYYQAGSELYSLMDYLFPSGSALLFIVPFYLVLGFLLFRYSEKISNKFIKGTKKKIATRELVLEMVVVYQGLGAIIFGGVYLILGVLGSLWTKEYALQFIGGYSFWIYLITMIFGIVLLLYYVPVARFINSKIPGRFWGK